MMTRSDTHQHVRTSSRRTRTRGGCTMVRYASQRSLGAEVAGVHCRQVAEDREAQVDERNEGSRDVADVDDLLVVALGDVEGRCGHNLLPTEAHVRAEDRHRADVENHPSKRLEDLELQAIYVAHHDRRAALVSNPEQAQMKDALHVDQIWWRANLVGLRLAKAKLEKVYCHEGEQGNARDGEIHLARGHRVVDRDVPGPFQRDEHVEQGGEQHVLLDDVGGEPEAGPIEPHVKIAISVEVVRPEEGVEVADRVDDDK